MVAYNLKSSAYKRIPIKFVYFLLILVLYVIILDSDGIFSSDSVYISNALVIIYSLCHLLADENRAYSGKKVFYLFIFFFMGIAPVLQYKNGDQTVGGYDILEITYVITNLLLLLTLVIFDLFYYLFSKYHNFNFVFNLFFKNIFSRIVESKKMVLMMLCISLFSLLFTIYYFRDNAYLLVFRGLDGLEVSNEASSGNYLDSLFHTFIRPLSVVCCINYWCIGKRKSLKLIFLLIMLLTCFPTSLARLRTAAYYLPLLIIMFPALKLKNRYVLLLSLGLLFFFPLLNSFRNWGGDLRLELDFSMFRSMNFDSYQSLAFVIQNDIVTYGQQLLLVLFFWVPRTIWESKPYMSGMMVADEYGLWFYQISMNYFGEGYINGGVAGMFIFAIILAYVTALFDKLYWRYNNGNIKSLFAPFYLFFIGLYFFFMRGDLMYGTQYTIMLLFANYVVFRLIKKMC